MNAALITVGFVLLFGGMLSPLVGARPRVAMAIAFLGVALFMTGAIRTTIEDTAACAAKGGVLIRSTCIERSSVIEVGR